MHCSTLVQHSGLQSLSLHMTGKTRKPYCVGIFKIPDKSSTVPLNRILSGRSFAVNNSSKHKQQEVLILGHSWEHKPFSGCVRQSPMSDRHSVSQVPAARNIQLVKMSQSDMWCVFHRMNFWPYMCTFHAFLWKSDIVNLDLWPCITDHFKKKWLVPNDTHVQKNITSSLFLKWAQFKTISYLPIIKRNTIIFI